ncbi:hypothetical protein GXW83_05025 [Streptacidiphilus sp. PB12-B1b]|uniref:hypothetical protein n=1 Tax=Streptacidiphilus sp. PB12-B1b TaxID=2705012 RepID=UPI0015F871A5|nr:hypothetical protein [Streptacidiphilus sp. PB12-B1b]QMU75215.1 hypothetical protein GXW83_05025 [Streptacidiphilus sp. PB12-B1b]
MPDPLRPRAALLLLCAGLCLTALLAGCAAGAGVRTQGLRTHGVWRSRPVQGAPAAQGRPSPRVLPAQPAPVRMLAVAYGPAQAPATAARTAPAAVRRPAPAPGRPAAPVGRQSARRARQPRAPQAAPVDPPSARRLPIGSSAPRPAAVDVCRLGARYGGWPAGSPEAATCRSVYG